MSNHTTIQFTEADMAAMVPAGKVRRRYTTLYAAICALQIGGPGVLLRFPTEGEKKKVRAALNTGRVVGKLGNGDYRISDGGVGALLIKRLA